MAKERTVVQGDLAIMGFIGKGSPIISETITVEGQTFYKNNDTDVCRYNGDAQLWDHLVKLVIYTKDENAEKINITSDMIMEYLKLLGIALTVPTTME